MAWRTLYQPLPAAPVKYTYMKHPIRKTMAIAITMVIASLIVHYLIGTMSY